MTQVPTFEKMILEVRNCLLGSKIDTKQKNKLLSVKGGITEHMEQVHHMLYEIFDFLELDEHATLDIAQNLVEFGSFNEAVRQKVWTYGADIRQVLWYVAGYLYMPGLGRSMAFWQLDEPMDRGMPGGCFWYLPVARMDREELVLTMPVTQVVEWLLDLLGDSVTTIKGKLGGGLVAGENIGRESGIDIESMERTLHKWLGGQTPDVATIHKYFPDSTELEFKGAFDVSGSDDINEKFQLARDFVRSKGLSVEELAHEIPLSDTDLIDHLLNSQADTVEDSIKKHFVELLINRYSAPTLKTIRRRLLLARATQDGYRQLVTVLLGKDFDYKCADQGKNKVLQLLAIFQLSYNLTVEAHEKISSVAGEEQTFSELLPELYKLDVFSSIDPSQRQESIEDSAELLTRVFSRISCGDKLPSLVPNDGHSSKTLTEEKKEFFEAWAYEKVTAKSLEDQLRRKSPWKVLQSVTNYWAIGRMINIPSLSYKARCTAAKRMYELASNPVETVNSICVQLALVLHSDDRKKQTKDSEGYVEGLLNEAKANAGYEEWKAPLLSYEAKHLLSKNDFSGARRKFKDALKASVERNHGTVHGEIARDALALEIGYQDNGYNLENCQYYYRNMLAAGCLELQSDYIPPLEDIAADMGAYFWSDLYKPYPGRERLTESKHSGADLIREGIDYSKRGDRSGFSQWLKNSRKKTGDKTLRNYHGGTVLGLWQKVLYDAEKKFRENAKLQAYPGVGNIALTAINNQRRSFYEIIQASPKSVSKVDYKGQSPAMLAASNADLESLEHLLELGADLSQQDYNGRTALHAAVAGGSLQCLETLLSCEGSERALGLKTIEGSSVLHTAVQLGNVTAVTRIATRSPGLLFDFDENNLRPVDLSILISNDKERYEGLIRALRRERRCHGNFSDYVSVSQYLSELMSGMVSCSIH